MITLPLHGQDTAAVELVVTGQAGPSIHVLAEGDVFGKQARFMFAEFLPLLLVFPCRRSSVGITVKKTDFSCLLNFIVFPSFWVR